MCSAPAVSLSSGPGSASPHCSSGPPLAGSLFASLLPALAAWASVLAPFPFASASRVGQNASESSVLAAPPIPLLPATIAACLVLAFLPASCHGLRPFPKVFLHFGLENCQVFNFFPFEWFSSLAVVLLRDGFSMASVFSCRKVMMALKCFQIVQFTFVLRSSQGPSDSESSVTVVCDEIGLLAEEGSDWSFLACAAMLVVPVFPSRLLVSAEGKYRLSALADVLGLSLLFSGVLMAQSAG